eukprot:TRINITY_DN6620_c0_g1_i2.p1 TRINITY_DN6620_c0_g1~~TRINITY_DN6620_c0_g1_i2.p1  ORF type:complete len:348 (-),score=72.64 TRINITY_DN6620_c0_g1_i2:312-1355(-)
MLFPEEVKTNLTKEKSEQNKSQEPLCFQESELKLIQNIFSNLISSDTHQDKSKAQALQDTSQIEEEKKSFPEQKSLQPTLSQESKQNVPSFEFKPSLQDSAQSKQKEKEEYLLLQERLRSNSFNSEFDTNSNFFRKDSLDVNDQALLKEFSNNFENIEKLFEGRNDHKQISQQLKLDLVTLEQCRQNIMTNIMNGNILETEKFLIQHFPKFYENISVQALLKYQYFIELIKMQKFEIAIEYAQNEMQELQNIDFIQLNEQQIPVKITFQEVSGLLCYNSPPVSNLGNLLKQQQRDLVADTINQYFMEFMGFAKHSILQLLLSQLFVIEQNFNNTQFNFGDKQNQLTI